MLCIKIFNTRFIFKLFQGHEGSGFLYEANSVFYFIICGFFFFFVNMKQRRGEWEVVVSWNLNTVCLLSGPAALPRKQPLQINTLAVI